MGWVIRLCVELIQSMETLGRVEIFKNIWLKGDITDYL